MVSTRLARLAHSTATIGETTKKKRLFIGFLYKTVENQLKKPTYFQWKKLSNSHLKLIVLATVSIEGIILSLLENAPDPWLSTIVFSTWNFFTSAHILHSLVTKWLHLQTLPSTQNGFNSWQNYIAELNLGHLVQYFPAACLFRKPKIHPLHKLIQLFEVSEPNISLMCVFASDVTGPAKPRGRVGSKFGTGWLRQTLPQDHRYVSAIYPTTEILHNAAQGSICVCAIIFSSWCHNSGLHNNLRTTWHVFSIRSWLNFSSSFLHAIFGARLHSETL